MFYVSRFGDTIGSISNAHYGNNLGELMLPRVIAANAHALPYGVGITGNDVTLPAYHIVYLPQLDITDQIFDWKTMASYLNSAPIESRQKISLLCEDGIDPRRVIAAVSAAIIRPSPHPEQWQKAREKTEQFESYLDQFDHLHELAEFSEKFEVAEKNMRIALIEYRENYKGHFFDKQNLKNAYKIFQSAFETRSIHHKIPLPLKDMNRHGTSAIGKKLFSLQNTHEAQQLIQALKKVRYIFIASDTVMKRVAVVEKLIQVTQVYEAYKAGDNWVKLAAEDIGEAVTTTILAATAGALLLSPVGWVGVLTDIAISSIGSHYGKAIVDGIWNEYDKMLKRKDIDYAALFHPELAVYF